MKKEAARKESKQDETKSSARARRLPVVNLWPGLIIELNILLSTRDDMLSLASLVHFSSLSMPLFPLPPSVSSLFLSGGRAQHPLSPVLPISPPDFFFFSSLPSELRSPRPAPRSLFVFFVGATNENGPRGLR